MTWILLFLSLSHAQWFDQGWNLEAAFGITNQEIINPDTTKAIYEGYGGHLLGYYPLFQSENFSFGPQIQYFYSELKNKANSSVLEEQIKFFGGAPGLELKVYNFFIAYNYRYQYLTVDLAGALSGVTKSKMTSPELVLGFEIPVHSWAFRIMYKKSEADIPQADTGLTSDSPWAEESVFLAIRYRFGKSAASTSAYKSSSDDEKTYQEGATETNGRTPYRSIRYSPRPSTRLNY